MRPRKREQLVFRLGRPGKLYDPRVTVDGASSRVSVVETRTGFWAVINQLHGLMRLPNSSFMSWWGVYTELCFWVVLFSAGTGVYLWTRRRPERLAGWWLLGGGSGVALLFMIYIYCVG